MSTHSLTPFQPICTTPTDTLEATCYVRRDVPPDTHQQIRLIQGRLQRLTETSLLKDLKIRQWPGEADTEDPTTEQGMVRERLVAKFERWAETHGYSLSPALQEQSILSSLRGEQDTHRKITVPVVMLTFEDPFATSESLQGVVPYTAPATDSEAARTCTVEDWLTAAEEVTYRASEGVTSRTSPTESVDSD